MREASTKRGPRYATAAAALVALAPTVYLVVRGIAHRRAPEPDPTVMLWTERSTLVGRVAVTGYVVFALVALVAPWLARRPAAAARAFDVSVAVSLVAALVAGFVR